LKLEAIKHEEQSNEDTRVAEQPSKDVPVVEEQNAPPER